MDTYVEINQIKNDLIDMEKDMDALENDFLSFSHQCENDIHAIYEEDPIENLEKVLQNALEKVLQNAFDSFRENLIEALKKGLDEIFPSKREDIEKDQDIEKIQDHIEKDQDIEKIQDHIEKIQDVENGQYVEKDLNISDTNENLCMLFFEKLGFDMSVKLISQLIDMQRISSRPWIRFEFSFVSVKYNVFQSKIGVNHPT